LVLSRGFFTEGHDAGLVRFYIALLSQAAVPTNLEHAVSFCAVTLVILAVATGSPYARAIVHYAAAVLVLPVLPVWRAEYPFTVAAAAIVATTLLLYFLRRIPLERSSSLLWVAVPILLASGLDCMEPVRSIVKYAYESSQLLSDTTLRTLSGAVIVLPIVFLSLLPSKSPEASPPNGRGVLRRNSERARTGVALALLTLATAFLSPWLAYALRPTFINRHELALISLSVLLLYLFLCALNLDIGMYRVLLVVPYVALGCLWNPSNAPFETATGILFALAGSASCLLWARLRSLSSTASMIASFCIAGIAFYFATRYLVPWSADIAMGLLGRASWGIRTGFIGALACWPQVLAAVFPLLVVGVLSSRGLAFSRPPLHHQAGGADEV